MTTANKEHYKYPYLLKDFRDDAGRVIIEQVNQVWSTDITYIKLETGFVYLAAIIDWHSKKILSWRLSNTMDMTLVKSVLNEALALYPAPELLKDISILTIQKDCIRQLAIKHQMKFTIKLTII